MASSLTAKRLREVLDYNPDTGEFRWKIAQRRYIGEVAGYRGDACGHRQIRIDGRAYYAHRLAWLYVHGQWPDNQIDHCDVDPSNNTLSNLRKATNQQNRQNVRSKRSDGRKGIHCTGRKWQAAIRVGGKRIYLGHFNTPDEAAAAYSQAVAQHHGEFGRAC